MMSKVNSEHGNFKTRAPWFKCFPTDWREGTRMLSAEHRGIYMDCLCLIYERDDHLPADDKWMSHALHVSNRAWRAARLALLRAGKLTFLQNGWSNSRADDERMKRRSTAEQNAMIARSRENQKREKSKKGNENNETLPRSVPRNEHHVRAQQTSDYRESESEKEVKQASVEQDAGGVLACLNGARFEMVETLAHWVSPYNPDRRTAQGWLESTCHLHGGETVKQAYGELKAKIAQGDVIARPIPLLNKLCERIKAERKAPAASGQKPSAMRAYLESQKANRQQESVP